MIFSKALPHCDTLFERFFDRHYDDVMRRRKLFPATRPDMIEDPELMGRNSLEVSPLDADVRSRAALQTRQILADVEVAWPTYLDVRPPIDVAWVDQFDRHYTRKRVRLLLKDSDPDDDDNPYVRACIEFGAVLGCVLSNRYPVLEWVYEQPYWESALFLSSSGTLIPVFHWAIKKLSSYGVDDGFVDKIEMCCEVLEGDRK